MDYNLYINSKNNTHSIFLNNHIVCEKNQSIRVSVKNFYILNSMYNITDDNNTFTLESYYIADGTITTNNYIIPKGNYSVLTFRDVLKSLLIGKIDIQYNIPSNTYTFLKTNLSYIYTIKNIKCGKQIGIYDDTEITSIGTTGSFVNMVDYSQIIVKSNLNYKDLNMDNIFYDDGMRISQILLFTSKQDVEPFKSITFSGEDFSYNLLNTNINNIVFTIVNERNEPIKNCGEWFLHLKFEILNDREDIMGKVLKVLVDIKYVLLNIFFKKK